MDLGLTGRRALVTGASAGLGLSCARALVGEGARVAIASRSTERIMAAAAELGGEVTPLTADVSDPDAAIALVAHASEAMGGVDIVIANAGGPPPGNFESTEIDAYLDAFKLNAVSTIALCSAAVPAMRGRGWGRVVAITSITVREPSPILMLSNTARAGLTGFLKTTSREVAGDGVTVNSLQPGLHRTARLTGTYGDDLSELAATVPAGRIGEPDDFGRVAAFLCSDAASFITGAAIPIDGGAAHGLQ
jgi:3-oxoacyl-[acyl-carrier protein] reductase